MSKYMGILLIVLGPSFLRAATTASQPCIERSIQLTPANDTAIMRARSSLEIPEIRVFMVTALHMIRVGGQPAPPTFEPCLIFEGAHESGPGADIAYRYEWRSGSRLEFNEVKFHCDTVGRIDRVEAGPSSDQAFAAFGDYLHQTQGKLTKFLIDKLTEPEHPETEDAFDKATRDIFAEVVAASTTSAYGVDPQRFVSFTLGELHDAQFKNRPARGIDGFLFGLDETQQFRQIAIQRSELRQAVEKIANISAGKAGVPDSGAYGSEADSIAAGADICAQITAHDAFSVTAGGNQGTENLTRLNPAFQVCTGYPTRAGTLARPRPLLFSVTPVGRGWRDAKGMRVQVWFQPHESDPTFTAEELFDRYGLFLAVLPQAELPCSSPPGGGTPPDHDWVQAGTTNVVYRFRFDCDHAEIYDSPSHLMIADLALQRSPKSPAKDLYRGTGPISNCPGGTGKVEISRWSPGRIDIKIERANTVDNICGGLKTGHILNAVTHDDTTNATFIPKTQ
jgi:hypothetical protein